MEQQFIQDVFKNIDKRNNQFLQKIQEERKEFNEKVDMMVGEIEFRNKIDRVRAAFNLCVAPEEADEIKELTKETSDRLMKRALEKTGGDMEKAIFLLFDPSSKIEI